MDKQTLEDNRTYFQLTLQELWLGSTFYVEYDHKDLKKPYRKRLSGKKAAGILKRIKNYKGGLPVASHVAHYMKDDGCQDINQAMVLTYLRIPIQATSKFSNARLIWES